MMSDLLAERPWWTYGDIAEGAGSPTDLCDSCGHTRWLHANIPCSAPCGCECDGGFDFHVACFVPHLAKGVAPGEWDGINLGGSAPFPEFYYDQIKKDERGNIIWGIAPDNLKP